LNNKNVDNSFREELETEYVKCPFCEGKGKLERTLYVSIICALGKVLIRKDVPRLEDCMPKGGM